MNTELTTLAPTMTSLEIAELTGKEHKHVLRDIRTMLDDLRDGPNLDHVLNEYDPRGYTECIKLPKDLTLTLVSGYSTALRHRIVTRWMELESQTAPAPNNAALDALRHILEAADREIEHRTRHDFYRIDNPRAQEHRAAVMAEVAHRQHLDAATVSLAYHRGIEAVMGEVYGDPIAQARLERQKAEQLRISKEYAAALMSAKGSKRRRRR